MNFSIPVIVLVLLTAHAQAKHHHDEGGEPNFPNGFGSGWYWSPCQRERYEQNPPVCVNDYRPVENADTGRPTTAEQANGEGGRNRCVDANEVHYFCALPDKFTKAFWAGIQFFFWTRWKTHENLMILLTLEGMK